MIPPPYPMGYPYFMGMPPPVNVPLDSSRTDETVSKTEVAKKPIRKKRSPATPASPPALPFTADEFVRLAGTMVHPDTKNLVSSLLGGLNKDQLDAKINKGKIWDRQEVLFLAFVGFGFRIRVALAFLWLFIGFHKWLWLLFILALALASDFIDFGF